MREPKKIDFGRLFGFDSVSNQISGRLDLRDAAFGAKLGAKVGEPEPGAPGLMRKSKKIDFAKLLGFETVCGRLAKGADFQDETLGQVNFQADSMSAKLGAKVGTEICLALDLLPAGSTGNSQLGGSANKDD